MTDSGEVPVDPAREQRHVDHARDAGVISVGRGRTAARGRWYYQDEWSAFTRRRVTGHLEGFANEMEFVEFAIEAAQCRRLPPPNAQAKTPKAMLWAPERIERALRDLLRGRTARSKTLQFFNAACDELDGLQWSGPEAAATMPAEAVAVIEEHEVEETDEAVTEDTEFVVDDDLRYRYVLMLIVKAEQYDGLPPEELLDRIERNLG